MKKRLLLAVLAAAAICSAEPPPPGLLKEILSRCPVTMADHVPPPSRDYTGPGLILPSTAPTLAELERWPELAPEQPQDPPLGIEVADLPQRHEPLAVEGWIRRKPDVQRLVTQLTRPGNREWWLDLDAVMKERPVQAGAFVQRLLTSRNPEVVRLARLCLWKLQPANAQFREQAIRAVVESRSSDISAVGTMDLMKFGSKEEQERTCLRLLAGRRIVPYWLPKTVPRKVLRAAHRLGHRERNAIQVLLKDQSPEQGDVELIVPYLGQLEWLDDKAMGKLLFALAPNQVGLPYLELPTTAATMKLIRDNPVVFCALVPNLPEDRRQQLEPVLRALWKQSPEDSQLLAALSSCRMNVPQRIADLRQHCLHQPEEDPQDISLWRFPEESATELWAAVDTEKDAMLARNMSRYAPLLPRTQALERLARGRLDLGAFLSVTSGQDINGANKNELSALCQREDAVGGIATAVLNRPGLDRTSPGFLAYYIATSLYLKHLGLSPDRLFQLQEGAPSELFQAAQAYLESDPGAKSQALVQQRGGRVLSVQSRGRRGENAWEQRYVSEFVHTPRLQRLLAFHSWEGDVVVRCWPESAAVQVSASNSRLERVRRLSAQDLTAIANLQLGSPAPLQQGPNDLVPVAQPYLELNRGGLYRRSWEMPQGEVEGVFRHFSEQKDMTRVLLKQVKDASLVGEFDCYNSRVWARGNDVRVGLSNGWDGKEPQWFLAKSRQRVPSPVIKPEPEQLVCGDWRMVNELAFEVGSEVRRQKTRLEDTRGRVLWRRGDGWKAVSYVPARRAFLLTRGDELRLLDPRTFKLSPPDGDLGPWAEPRHIVSGRWWVARAETGGTRVSCYAPSTCSRSAGRFYPGIVFTTSDMWVDRSWVYAAVGREIVRLPLFESATSANCPSPAGSISTRLPLFSAQAE